MKVLQLPIPALNWFSSVASPYAARPVVSAIGNIYYFSLVALRGVGRD